MGAEICSARPSRPGAICFNEAAPRWARKFVILTGSYAEYKLLQ